MSDMVTESPSGRATSIADWLKKNKAFNWTFLDQALVSGANFLTSVLLARLLGLEAFGVFSAVWMVVLFLNSLQGALIISPMMSLGPKQEGDNASSYYGSVFALQIGFGVSTSVLLWLGGQVSWAFVPTWDIRHLAASLAIATFTYNFQDFLRRFFFSRAQPQLAFANDAVSYLSQLAILALAFQWGPWSVSHVLWTMALTSLVAALLGLVALRPIRFIPARFIHFSKMHWGFGKWLLLSAQLNNLTMYPLLIALGTFVGGTALGLLMAARNLVGALHIVFMGLDNFIQPGAAKAYRDGGPNEGRRFIYKHMVLAGIPVTAICLTLFCFPQAIATLFYGDLLKDNTSVVSLFAVAYMLTFCSKSFTYQFLAAGQTHVLPVVDGIKAAAVVCLAVPAVKWFGISGVMGCVVFVNLLGLTLLQGRVKRLYLEATPS